ncbi:MAG: hypothetical protein M1586_02865 [Patescibacteria group bacterium]|nr:hypothetical protein [Patescibacteria group bacterium]
MSIRTLTCRDICDGRNSLVDGPPITLRQVEEMMAPAVDPRAPENSPEYRQLTRIINKRKIRARNPRTL